MPDINLLNDDQVRRFIADGFLVLDSGMEPAFHSGVTEALDFSFKVESLRLADNLVPRIPQLQDLLESPRVHGAVSSLLGADFAWTPHRFPHNSEPLGEPFDESTFDPFANQPQMGKGSRSGSGWHQDGHSKAARSRWHTFRAINVFYFPHDTPLEMGPTRLLAGTHLYATLRDTVPQQLVHQPMKSGTFIVADFDIGHAGTPNRTDNSRYMLKFVALRLRNPIEPSWKHCDPSWETPADRHTPDDLPVAWQSLWNWLRGAPRDEGITKRPTSELPSLIEAVKSRDNTDRLNALYMLVAIGKEAVPVLVNELLKTSGKDRHVSPPMNDPGFAALSTDHRERRFSQRQFVPEDSAIALGAIGKDALDSLVPLIDHEDPWVRINSTYAIGEIGDDVPAPVADRVGKLLDDPLDCVVRATLDALCAIPNWGSATAKRIHRLLAQPILGGEYAAMGEGKANGAWTIQNQIRYVAAWALRSRIIAPNAPKEIEPALIDALEENTGYTPAVACQALQELQSPEGLNAAIGYLSTRRWDATPAPRRR